MYTIRWIPFNGSSWRHRKWRHQWIQLAPSIAAIRRRMISPATRKKAAVKLLQFKSLNKFELSRYLASADWKLASCLRKIKQNSNLFNDFLNLAHFTFRHLEGTFLETASCNCTFRPRVISPETRKSWWHPRKPEIRRPQRGWYSPSHQTL